VSWFTQLEKSSERDAWRGDSDSCPRAIVLKPCTQTGKEHDPPTEEDGSPEREGGRKRAEHRQKKKIQAQPYAWKDREVPIARGGVE